MILQKWKQCGAVLQGKDHVAAGVVCQDNVASASANGVHAIALSDGGVTLTALEAVVPKKVSVLVYLDGTVLNNMSVFNGRDSGTMVFNFQFSSSADLTPMVDSELKNAVSADGVGG